MTGTQVQRVRRGDAFDGRGLVWRATSDATHRPGSGPEDFQVVLATVGHNGARLVQVLSHRTVGFTPHLEVVATPARYRTARDAGGWFVQVRSGRRWQACSDSFPEREAAEAEARRREEAV